MKNNKVLVVGAGGVGAYFGGRLAQAGMEVAVLCRSNYEQVKKSGFDISSIAGDFTFKPSGVYRSCAEYPETADYLLVTTKVLPDINLVAVLPELILLAAAVGVLFLRAPGSNGTALGTALAAVALSVFMTPFLYGELSGTAFSGAIAKDDAALFFIFLADLAVLIALALSRNDTAGDENGEAYYGLLLFALFGMHVMISARDLLVLFLGLEILSLPFYVLTGFHRKRKEGLEGAVKYFLLGSFSSALFLLGMALYYGAAGTTSLGVLASAGQPVFLFAGLAFVTAGLAFKIAAVPFHMWAPDVYEGAPLSVAACISVAPKVAAFAVLLHLGLLYAGSGADFFPWAVAAMAASRRVVRKRRMDRVLRDGGCRSRVVVR